MPRDTMIRVHRVERVRRQASTASSREMDSVFPGSTQTTQSTSSTSLNVASLTRLTLSSETSAQTATPSSSSGFAFTPSLTPLPGFTSIQTSNAFSPPAFTQAAQPNVAPPVGSTSILVFTSRNQVITMTSIVSFVPSSISSSSSSDNTDVGPTQAPKSFFENKPLEGSVFGILGLIVLATFIGISTMALRKTRKDRLHREALEVSEEVDHFGTNSDSGGSRFDEEKTITVAAAKRMSTRSAFSRRSGLSALNGAQVQSSQVNGRRESNDSDKTMQKIYRGYTGTLPPPPPPVSYAQHNYPAPPRQYATTYHSPPPQPAPMNYSTPTLDGPHSPTAYDLRRQSPPLLAALNYSDHSLDVPQSPSVYEARRHSPPQLAPLNYSSSSFDMQPSPNGYESSAGGAFPPRLNNGFGLFDGVPDAHTSRTTANPILSPTRPHRRVSSHSRELETTMASAPVTPPLPAHFGGGMDFEGEFAQYRAT